ncbi:IclR family transcriptional regulator [Nocardioides sp. W7]|uniref:IclR family transcriptional regulator n=1 Tax=Nocardioides sp. W7 TaxID=2931390 RepID=UPI001FD41E76|nr:IclR family transcriptional regulator [Nocardioides sp. W7]
MSGASSARKLLNMLLCFTEQRPIWSVAEMAVDLSLPTTTAYRYVGLLREVGLLEPAGDGGYRLTDLTLGLAKACEAAQRPLEVVALPVMHKLRADFDETVLVARRSGTAAYCVERVESERPVRLQFDRGQAMSLHSGALARLLLASMPRLERRRYVDQALPQLSPERAVTLSEESLDRNLAEGWTESFEEIDEGIWGCAAVIRMGADVVAAIGTAAPVYRTDADRRDRIASSIRAAADEISGLLGR